METFHFDLIFHLVALFIFPLLCFLTLEIPTLAKLFLWQYLCIEATLCVLRL